ncbi:unnamed protein product, partial [Prorocentrum cordatum]
MDFNAGRFQDDLVPMDRLGAELFGEMLRVAAGGRSAGELAGHSQVSIWREWAQDGPVADPSSLRLGEREGQPLALPGPGALSDLDVRASDIVKDATFSAAGGDRNGTERLGLILPTSLCSGEIARRAAEELNALRAGGGAEGPLLGGAFDRFAALPHTEGCGNGYSGDGEQLFTRVLLGHLLHANVAGALLLEHGCEKSHNSWMTEEMRLRGLDPTQFGWASAQLDGGIDKVLARVHDWFLGEARRRSAEPGAPPAAEPGRGPAAPLRSLPVAVVGDAARGGAASLAAGLVRAFVGAGGTVIVPSSAAIWG